MATTTTVTSTTGSQGGAPAGPPDPTQGIIDTLTEIVGKALSPDAVEAQSMLLRRLALEGDVIPSRIPAPRNISEIGGYLNLLTTLGETGTRSQVLASVLGVAGTNPPPGWVSTVPPALTWTSIPNDRPEGSVQPTIPTSVLIRSDFAGPLTAQLRALRAQGCLVPLLGGPVALPSAGPAAGGPVDPLPYIGRMLAFPVGAALVDPQTDALALVRGVGATTGYELAAIARGPAAAITPADSMCAPVTLTAATVVRLASALGTAGFYPIVPASVPATTNDSGWSRMTNVTGLVAGQTRLGDELGLLYSANAIVGSVFAGALDRVWNGTSFAPR
jgi:hypothetical protein